MTSDVMEIIYMLVINWVLLISSPVAVVFYWGYKSKPEHIINSP